MPDSNGAVPAPPQGGFRADINGLRTIAIVPVVAFHAGLIVLGGGFIGVDVFFVISGFLITGALLREGLRTGTVKIWSFWAKRLRRLVPALALVVAVTLPVVTLLRSPLVWQDIATQAFGSLVYVSNMVFARQATDYFAEDLNQSPFLHTWSLGVEEQFYLLWPFLVILACAVARLLGRSPRTVLVIGFAAAALVSFAISLWLTDYRPSWAFYALPTRAWEFAIGGLIAAIPATWRSANRWVPRSMTTVGVAVIVVGVFVIRSTDPFPGTAALVPVIGTALVIAGGLHNWTSRNPVADLVLGNPVMQWIGARSYSWYLWHWPFIIIGALVFGHTVPVMCIAALLSLLAAMWSYRFVENRFRFAPALVASLKRTYLATLAVTAVIGLIAAAVFAGGAVLRTVQPIAAFAQAQTGLPESFCDAEVTSPDGDEQCVLGDPDAATTIILAGDSHAGMWREAVGDAAAAIDARVIVRYKSACPSIPVAVVNTRGVRDADCAPFQQETLRLIDSMSPDLVLLANTDSYSTRILADGGGLENESAAGTSWGDAFEEVLTRATDVGAAVANIEDNPWLPSDPTECATRLGASIDSCTPTRDSALADIAELRGVLAERTAAAGVAEFPMIDRLCDDASCRIVDADGQPIWRDNNHLARDYVTTLVPEMTDYLASALAS